VKDLVDKNRNITMGQRLKGHFILTRPQQLIWLDVFGAVAFFAIVTRHAPSLHFLLFILCAVITDAGACTLNDVGDLGSDCKSTETSRKNRPLCTGVISRRSAMVQGYTLYIIGLAIALFLDIYVFLFAFALVLISHQYSMYPLKMDAKPVVSQLFWVAFGFLYYFALIAYLNRYDVLTQKSLQNGLFFLGAMILFLGLGETLAKDLRDLENDRAGGKGTTSTYFGAKAAVSASFTFSVAGSIFWMFPYFTVYETPLILQVLVLILVYLWNAICLMICISIYKYYTKRSARKLHKGFILTFTLIMTLSFIGGIL
jgi:4-hydroxybenzoate polyprenyltransferase